MGRGYIPPQGAQEQQFVKRITDLIQTVRSKGIVRCTLFCNERECALAEAMLSREGCATFLFDGGYPAAERKILCIYPEGGEPSFGIAAFSVQATAAKQTLTHRDYLGALMALGMKRECIGDIILEPGGAKVFISDKLAEFVCESLTSVGNYTVHTTLCNMQEIVQAEQQTVERTATLPSLRLDALLAAMLCVSRGEAAELIRKKMVMINHVETDSLHAAVCENDVFTVRGKGKYRLSRIGGQSKKDRTFVSFIQY